MSEELLRQVAVTAELQWDPELKVLMLGKSDLARLAHHIAEECAKECDSLAEKPGTNRLQQLALDLAADAIREKFQE